MRVRRSAEFLHRLTEMLLRAVLTPPNRHLTSTRSLGHQSDAGADLVTECAHIWYLHITTADGAAASTIQDLCHRGVGTRQKAHC